MPDDEVLEYLATQAIADFLARRTTPWWHRVSISSSGQAHHWHRPIGIGPVALQPPSLPSGRRRARRIGRAEQGRKVPQNTLTVNGKTLYEGDKNARIEDGKVIWPFN
jgi:hypothetical protein